MRDELTRRIDTIEAAYEFMLAYAAQGVAGERGSEAGGQVREFLAGAAEAVSGLADAFAAVIHSEALDASDPYRAFADVLEHDARTSLAALELVLIQPDISSEMVDNLNASIHLRALLTDLFLLDSVLKLET